MIVRALLVGGALVVIVAVVIGLWLWNPKPDQHGEPL